VASERLAPGPSYGAVLEWAIDLAAVLDDPALRETLETLAADPTAVEARLVNPEAEPPPPPPAPDSMTITVALSPAEVAPGGVTEVTVQVEPAQAGVPVDVWTSASGDGIGVFGESSDLTDANGVFSTTYTAGSTVQVETIWASTIDNDGQIIEASADLTVGWGLVEVAVTLSPAEVAPGGVTEVTVQVEPAQAGVWVDVLSSVSGEDSSCLIPIGVFGESDGLTDENGVFSTTYKAGLNVQVETITASVLSNDGVFLDSQASLTVKGACETQADRLVAEYSIKGTVAAPPCGAFQNHGDFAPFSWVQWTGGASGNPSAASGGYGLIMMGISYLVVHLQEHFDVTFGIESGYRSPCGNSAVGGSSGSYHQLGKAADLWIQGLEDSYSTRVSIRDYVLATQIGWSYVYGNHMIHVDTEYR
jgi:hypothetical protein